jgi:thioredoxin-like negative regulator of GroEL
MRTLGAAIVLSAIGCEATSYFTRNRSSTPTVDSPQAALAAIRESRDPGLRRAAFEYLGDPRHLGGEAGDRDEVTTILGLALQSETEPQSRIVILDSMARLASAKRLEAMSPAVTDKEPAVRVAACRHLGRTGAAEAAAKLDQLLVSDPSLDVRLAAADALAHIPTREAAMSLLTGIEDPDVAMRYRCRQSLKQITGKDYSGNVGEWRQEIQTANFEELAKKRHFGMF